MGVYFQILDDQLPGISNEREPQLPNLPHHDTGDLSEPPDTFQSPPTDSTDKASAPSPPSVTLRSVRPLVEITPSTSKTINKRTKTSSYLTDTPVKEAMEAAAISKEQAKLRKDKTSKAKKTEEVIESQSSTNSSKRSLFSKKRNDEDMDLTSDSEMETTEDDDDIIEGDFVIVQIAGKCRQVNYIARIDSVDGIEYEGVFLKKVPGRIQNDGIYIINEDDQAQFMKADVVRKLPVPSIVGGSARKDGHLKFKYIHLEKYNIGQ